MASDCDVEALQAEALAEALGSASRILTKKETNLVPRLAGAIHRVMRSSWLEFLSQCEIQGTPVLWCYMSDGWACNMSKSSTVATPAGPCVRVGRFRAEFLAEKQILKGYDKHNQITSFIMISPPLSIVGKSGWHIYGACGNHPHVRLHFQSSVSIAFHIQDGLHAASMIRRQQARHEVYHDWKDSLAEDAASSRFKNRYMDWCLGIRCVLHSASSAIKWGLSTHASEEILDDLHLSIKSARNTSYAIHKAVQGFVSRHLQFKTSEHSHEDRCQWWMSMGVSPNLVDWVMQVDPRYDESTGYLYVVAHLAQDSACFELVCDVVQFFMRWTDFSDTRWAGVGNPSRLFILSLAVGLPSLRDIVDANAVGNDRYNLSALKNRLSPEVKKLAAIASLASYPLEAVSLALLEDDRWVMHADTLMSDAGEDAQWVSQLPSSVWMSLANVVGDAEWHWTNAKSDIMLAMRTSMAYYHREAYEVLTTSPFILCKGDIKSNVEWLASLPEPPEGLVACKVHFCSRFYPEEAVAALRLLKEAPCSVGLVEKGHSAGALIKRQHGQMEPESLESRAFVCEAKPLLRQGQWQHREKALQAKFQCSLAKASRVRFTAQNAFCSQAISTVTSDTTMATIQRKRLSENIVASHNKKFKDMDAGSQQSYRKIASAIRFEKACWVG